MLMKGLNIKIEEPLYEKLRAYSFVQKKPMTAMIREYIALGLEKDKELFKEKKDEMQEIDDELFMASIKESFDKFDDVYKKLAK